MARSRRPSRAVLALAACTILPALAAQQPDAIPVAKGVARAALADLPVRIEPNLGQWQSPELYRLRAGGLDVFLERDGWSFWLREPDPVAGGRRPSQAGGPDTVRGRRALALRMGFVGGGAARVSPERPLPGVTNYLVGDQKGHRANVPGYAAVLYEEMYPGVDLRVREGGGHMEYDLLLAPGAALDQVRVQVTGAQALRVDSNGALVLETALGDVVQPAPATWMTAATADGQREPVACEFVLLGRDTFGFAAPDRDPTRALVVDPPLQYASYVGGSGYDEPWHVTVAADGDILCCGYTESANFPVTPGAVQTTYGTNADGWIVRIDPGQPGQFEFATYVGGANWDTVYAVHELASGVLAFAGGTQSPSLPVTANAYQLQLSGPTDAIVGLLDAGGTTLNALTYFGGSGTEWARGVAFDLALQQLVIAGSTFSVDLPTQNAYQPNNAGGTNFRDGFVTTFDLAPGDLSTIGMSTYLGGSGDDWLAIASGETLGIVTVYGGTESADFPTSATAFQPTFTGGGANWWSQAIGIAQLDLLNNGLAYGTYVDAGGDEVVGEVHASLGGRDLFVVGTTTSINLPTTPGAYQSSFQGGSNNQGFVAGDAFAMRIDTSMAGAAGLTASSYFGGSFWDQGLAIAVDSGDEIVISGWTEVSSTMPSTPGADRRLRAGNDGFLARFSPDLKQLYYGGFVGGTDYDGVWHLHATGAGDVTVAGITFSVDLPVTANAAQSQNGGGDETWVGQFALIPANTTRYGGPSPGVAGHPTIHAVADATLNNPNFGLACTRAPANTLGVIVFAFGSAPGTPLQGVDLWIDPNQIVATSFLFSDANGEIVWPLPTPGFSFTLFSQFFWLENSNPLQLSASDALQIN